MKRKKVCALLCVAALSTATITPAMAADNTADAQTATESAVVNEEQADAADTTQEAKPADETDESETQETPAQEEQSEGTEQTEETQDVDNADVSNEQTTESAPAKEETVQNDTDGEDTVQKDGWYQDPTGWYYYENGEKITNEIVEIEDEDGTYGYYFDSDGIMFKSGETWVNYWDEENEIWLDGNIRADEYGHLYKGWYEDWNGEKFYGDDYFQYYNRILEEGDNLYYFDNYGVLVKNKEIIVGDVLYKADENGVLTVVDTTGRKGWSQSGDDWYYYEDKKERPRVCDELLVFLLCAWRSTPQLDTSS